MYTTLDYVTENFEASGEGYICGIKDENWVNYLKNHHKFAEIEELHTLFNQLNLNTVTVISNIYVEDDCRNNGFGTEVLETIYNESLSESDAIILIADTLETNDINLVTWYSEYGFKILKSTNKEKLPVMIHINK